MSISWRRVFRWSLCLVCLILLGVGIYRFEADEPRWTVDSREAPIDWCHRFSADGKSLYTEPSGFGRSGPGLMIRLRSDAKIESAKKLQVWDVATGKAGANYPKNGRLTDTANFSADGRYFAGVCDWDVIPPTGEERFVCLVDLQTGEERQLALSWTMDNALVEFSPCGRYIVVGPVRQFGPVQIYESATGQRIEERWCHGFLSRTTFTSDYLLLASRDDDDHPQILLLSLTERKIAATLANTNDHAFASANGKFLIAIDECEGSWIAWNLHTHKIAKTWKAQEPPLHSPKLVMDGNRCLALLSGTASAKGFIEAWDLATGERIARNENVGLHYMAFLAPHSRFMAMYEYQPREFLHFGLSRDPANLRIVELPSLEERWRMNDVHYKFVDFTNDECIIAVPMEGSEIQIRDGATGLVKQTVSLHPNTSESAQLSMTRNGKHLLIQHGKHDSLLSYGTAPTFWRRTLQWVHLDSDHLSRDLTIVHDLETNRERLLLRGWSTTSGILSDDGTTLITTHDDDDGNRVMRCWDVGSTKPLRWPLAIPAALGVLLWGLVKRVARWRKRRADTQHQVPAAKSA